MRDVTVIVGEGDDMSRLTTEKYVENVGEDDEGFWLVKFTSSMQSLRIW